jgi:hypothetical protein
MKIVGNIAPITNSGDISQATLLAGPIDKRTLDSVTVKATITGASAAGTVQLYGVIGPPNAESQAPNGLAWPSTAADLIPIGSAVTFSAAGSTAWDVGTKFSALYVGWAKTGTSTGTLAVTWNG